MAAAMRAVPPQPSQPRPARTAAAFVALIISVVLALAGVVALVVALDALFGWAWATLATVPVLGYGAYVAADHADGLRR